MLTRNEALAIYHAGPKTVARVLLAMDARIHALEQQGRELTVRLDKFCACGHTNKAAFPEGVNAPVQYGSGVKAAAVYLKNYQFLPYERTCELLGDFFAPAKAGGRHAGQPHRRMPRAT